MQRYLVVLLVAGIIVAGCGIGYGEKFMGEMHVIGHQGGADGGEAGDIDGDGKIDVVVAAEEGGTVVWYRQNSPDDWTEYILAAELPGPEDAAVGDLDGDGKMDAAASCEGDMLVIMIQPEDPTEVPWPQAAILQGSELIGSAINCHMHDVDLDGDLDVMYCDKKGGDKGGIYWVENPSPKPVTVISNWVRHRMILQEGSWWAEPLDITGNGKSDFLCTARRNGHKVFWLERPEDVKQEWIYHEISGTVKDPRWMALGDISGNGDKMDFALGNHGGYNKITWFEHTAEGWTKEHLIANISRCMGVQVGNIDDDPELEVVANTYVGTSGPSQVLVYDRDADGNWEKSLISASMGEGDCILRVDIDGDGVASEFITTHGGKGQGETLNAIVWWKFQPASVE